MRDIPVSHTTVASGATSANRFVRFHPEVHDMLHILAQQLIDYHEKKCELSRFEIDTISFLIVQGILGMLTFDAHA